MKQQVTSQFIRFTCATMDGYFALALPFGLGFMIFFSLGPNSLSKTKERSTPSHPASKNAEQQYSNSVSLTAKPEL